MLFLPDFILLGGMGFWLILSLFALLELLYCSAEKYGWATFMLFLFGVLIYSLLGNTVRLFFVEHWQLLLILAVGYVVAGVVWAITKWFLYCAKRARTYSAARESFYQKNNIPTSTPAKDLTAEQRDNFLRQLNATEGFRDHLYNLSSVVPNVSENKGRITAWMTWWVFDIINTILHDLIRDLIDAIYRSIKGMLQQISNKCFAKFKQDIS